MSEECLELEKLELSEEVELLWNQTLERQKKQAMKELSSNLGQQSGSGLVRVAGHYENPAFVNDVDAPSPESLVNRNAIQVQRQDTKGTEKLVKVEFISDDELSSTLSSTEGEYYVEEAEEEEAKPQPNQRQLISDAESVSKNAVLCGVRQFAAESACGDFLLIGKAANETLELALQEIRKQKGVTFTVVSVNGKPVSSLTGIPLKAYMNAVILDANKALQKYVLVLEDFKREQIIDLYESNFIGKVSQVGSLVVHVIFLSSFTEKVETFSGAGKKHFVSELQKDSEGTSISNGGSGLEVVKASIEWNNEVPSKKVFEMGKAIAPMSSVVTTPPVYSWAKMPTIMTQPLVQPLQSKQNDLQEVKIIEREQDVSPPRTWNIPRDFATALNDNENARWVRPELTEPARAQTNYAAHLLGVWCFIQDMIVQCGDCCFY